MHGAILAYQYQSSLLFALHAVFISLLVVHLYYSLSLPLELVVMLRSKELKTSRSVLMLVLCFSIQLLDIHLHRSSESDGSTCSTQPAPEHFRRAMKRVVSKLRGTLFTAAEAEQVQTHCRTGCLSLSVCLWYWLCLSVILSHWCCLSLYRTGSLSPMQWLCRELAVSWQTLGCYSQVLSLTAALAAAMSDIPEWPSAARGAQLFINVATLMGCCQRVDGA